MLHRIKVFILIFLAVISAATGFVVYADTLTDQISDRKSKIDEINQQIADYQKKIQQKQSEASTLKNELNILSNQISKNELEIKVKQAQIEDAQINIDLLQGQVGQKNSEIEKQKIELSEIIRLMFRNDQKDYLEVLFANNNFSDFFNQVEYSESIQKKLQISLENLVSLKQGLEKKQSEVKDKKMVLVGLNAKLQDAKEALLDKKDAKNILMQKTKTSEKEFQKLVTKLKAEQAQINAEIAALEKKMRQNLTAKQAKQIQSLGSVVMQWPVPSRVITAYFHDSDYPYRYVYEHPAVDIRAAQGTPIAAAEAGYIGRAKNAGMGYSYIMIIHNDQVATVYGHVSKIIVSDDDFVTKGQIIGYSGGTPGTPGAGNMTSGPHLHFEVRVGGIPVNPLDYLP